MTAETSERPGATDTVQRFLATLHPFDLLSPTALAAVVEAVQVLDFDAGATVYARGTPIAGLHVVASGAVELAGADGVAVSRIQQGESFGRRALMRGGFTSYGARAAEATRILLVPVPVFGRLVQEEPGFAGFFARRAEPAAPAGPGGDLSLLAVEALMTPDPVCVDPAAPVTEAAGILDRRGISCVLVAEAGRLVGLLTASDLCGRVIAAGRSGTTPVGEVMTPRPVALTREAIGLDAITLMIEKRIGHLPVVEDDRPVGIVTRTNLLLRQGLSAPMLLGRIARESEIAALAAVVAEVPQFLAQLVGSGAEPGVVGRLVTDVTDALTRRLLALAEARLGPPPVPYLWLACGSQGRREQTGVSDQDNCLILDDAMAPADDAYFEALARFVSDGLNACGFVYCPGEMMATNPRWRQPLAVWRSYFRGWIEKPDPMAQMLASVMFDLRPIGGDTRLFDGLHAETLAMARANSIFIAHMVRNSLSHTPPLGLLRGFALIRSGEHKNRLDMKLNGVVPIVDLARCYALTGALEPVGTRARLVAAREAGVISETGGADLIDAYDLIARIRLEHQARLIREGRRPDNFLAPATLSELERNHLKDAFLVVRTMQSALGQGRHTLT